MRHLGLEGGATTSTLLLNGRLVDFRSGSVTDHHGTAITLRPKTAEILKQLALRQGEIVTKDELMQAAWGPINVGDDSVVQCIIEIRKALGDKKRQIVRVLPKRGYLLEANVAKAAVPVPAYRWLGVAAGAAVFFFGADGLPVVSLRDTPDIGRARKALEHLERDLASARGMLDNRIADIKTTLEGARTSGTANAREYGYGERLASPLVAEHRVQEARTEIIRLTSVRSRGVQAALRPPAPSVVDESKTEIRISVRSRGTQARATTPSRPRVARTAPHTATIELPARLLPSN